jgi:hypothetical protein
MILNYAEGAFRRRRAFAIGVLLWALAGGCVARDASDAKANDVKKLETTFGVIQSLRVTTWHDQDWCQAFQYDAGTFLTTSNRSTCTEFDRPAQGFDSSATADFVRVRGVFQNAGIWPIGVTVWYSPDGSIERAWFELESGMYQYSRDGVWARSEATTFDVTGTWQWSIG